MHHRHICIPALLNEPYLLIFLIIFLILIVVIVCFAAYKMKAKKVELSTPFGRMTILSAGEDERPDKVTPESETVSSGMPSAG